MGRGPFFRRESGNVDGPVKKAESRGKTGYLEIKRYAIVPDVLGYSVKELLHFASSSDYVV
jgi:hypothetical protein